MAEMDYLSIVRNRCKTLNPLMDISPLVCFTEASGAKYSECVYV